MGRQALRLGQDDGVPGTAGGSGRLESYDVGAADEILHSQGGAEAGAAAGRQHVAAM